MNGEDDEDRGDEGDDEGGEKVKRKVGGGDDGDEEGDEEGDEDGDEDGDKEELEEEPPPPPPPDQEKELLFLIEFLVDTLTVIPENMNLDDIDPCALQGPARVALTFLHFPPMLINEKDLDPERVTGGDVVPFNAGKSLMFALTESQFEEPPPVFLMVEASRETRHAFRVPFVPIGKTKIQLSELFKQVFDKYDECPGKTVSKSVKDKYDLIGEKGKTAGDISVYIRLTCLGQNIVTEFAKAQNFMDTVLFKNKESRRVYECRETEKEQDCQGLTLPGWGDERRDKTCYEDSPAPLPPDPEDENFEEIFAEINGSAILIEMEKSSRKEKPKDFHVSEFCDCNVPLPQHLVSGMSDLSLSPASEGSINLGTGSPVETDKRVGLDEANQLMFRVPPVETLAQPGIRNTITYNVKTCNDGDKHGHKGQSRFRVIRDNNPDGPPPKMPNDPEKDVFVLRIIKKGKKDKAKDVLQVEFKTPKEKIVPPPRPPYMIERAVGQEKSKKEKKK